MSVVDLQKIVFSQLSLNEKVEIKSRGRPLPDLQITQALTSRKSIYQRKFSRDVYFKYDWLCGCDFKNALFCFPCLIFGGDLAWTKTGIKDLGHLPEKIKKHENSEKHFRNVIDLAMLGTINIATRLIEAP